MKKTRFAIIIVLCLSFLLISLTFLLGFIPLFSIITGINFCGNNLSKLFLNCLFLNSAKSLNILSSNFSSDNAGLKSILKTIFLFFKSSSIFLYLTKCAEPLKIVGLDLDKI